MKTFIFLVASVLFSSAATANYGMLYNCYGLLAHNQAVQRHQVVAYQQYFAQVQAAKGLRQQSPLLAHPRSMDGEIDFDSDYDFLRLERDRTTRGNFHSQYLPALGTYVHYSLVGMPTSLSEMPVVSDTTKGLVIYLPGAGTQGVGGEAFGYHANQLASLGYGSVSLNYPFHSEGTNNEYLKYNQYLIQWLQALLFTVLSGRPDTEIILVGHSFGANLLAELITWMPFISNKALALSPGAVDQTMDYWNSYYTPRAVLGRTDFKLNQAGAQWVYSINSQMLFKQQNGLERYFGDPTLANQRLQLRFVWGENDIFLPGPTHPDGTPIEESPRTYTPAHVLPRVFSRVSLHEEQGVGHQLMGYKDPQTGQSLVMREILALLGESPAREKELRQTHTGQSHYKRMLLTQRYFTDPIFRHWVSLTGKRELISRLIREPLEREALELAKEYDQYLRQRRDRTLLRIKNLEKIAPEFYAAHSEDIEAIGTKNFPANRLLNNYLNYLEGLSELARASYGDHGAVAPE